MEETSYKRLTLQDRIIVQTLWGHKGITKTEIAKRLNKHKSTVCREINKWGKGDKNTYDAQIAHWLAEEEYATKHFKDKMTSSKKLKRYVFSKLKDH